MITIQGKGVSKGIAKGPLYFFRRSEPLPAKETGEAPEREKARLLCARQQSAAQLRELAGSCEEVGAALFETHAMLAEDEDFAACMDELLEQEKCTAEYAAGQAGERFATLFAQLDDPYMRERAADIRDVTGSGKSEVGGAGHTGCGRFFALGNHPVGQGKNSWFCDQGRFRPVPYRCFGPHNGDPCYMRSGRRPG